MGAPKLRSEQEIADFHERRKTMLGGTDMAAIMGVNKYKSGMDVWREKMGLNGEKEVTEAMRWGTSMGPLLLERCRELIEDRSGGGNTVESGHFCRHNAFNYLGGHLDGVVVDLNVPDHDTCPMIAVVECKTAGPYMRQFWGEPWTDAIPDQYLIQVQHYMLISGLPLTYVGVLFGNKEFLVYVVKRNDDLIREMRDIGVSFWENYVLTKEPPPVDGSKASEATLREMFPSDTGEIVQAPDTLMPTILRLKSFTKQKVDIDAQIQEAKNQIIAEMADAAIMETPEGRISYKKAKDGEKVDWKKVVTELLEKVSFVETKGLIQQAIVNHTKPTVGSRRFLPPKEWKKDEE